MFSQITRELIPHLSKYDCITAFLSGSKSTGLAHKSSDYDITVISKNISTVEPFNFKQNKYDIKIITTIEVNESIRRIVDLNRMDYCSLNVLTDIYNGIPLIHSKEFIEIKESVPWDLIIEKMIKDRVRGCKFYIKDAIKFYQEEDRMSGNYCMQRAIESIIDAYLFYNKSLIVKEKWRLKGLCRIDTVVFNRFTDLSRLIWLKEFDNTLICQCIQFSNEIFHIILPNIEQSTTVMD